MKAEPPFTPAN